MTNFQLDFIKTLTMNWFQEIYINWNLFFVFCSNLFYINVTKCAFLIKMIEDNFSFKSSTWHVIDPLHLELFKLTDQHMNYREVYLNDTKRTPCIRSAPWVQHPWTRSSWPRTMLQKLSKCEVKVHKTRIDLPLLKFTWN